MNSRFPTVPCAAVLVGVLLAAVPKTGLADSVLFGAATRCDTKQKTFELAAVVEFNEQTTVVASSLHGVRQLRRGKHDVSCNIGAHRVTAHVASLPASQGQCMGSGYVALKSLSVGARKLYDGPADTPFNFSCPSNSDEMLISIRIRPVSDVSPPDIEVHRCTAKDWTWDAGYVDVRCTLEVLR